jgi:hypothetical protein
MISSTAPEKGPTRLPEYEHFLRLGFADVDFLSNDLSSRAAEKLPAAMTHTDAENILHFVQALPLHDAQLGYSL